MKLNGWFLEMNKMTNFNEDNVTALLNDPQFVFIALRDMMRCVDIKASAEKNGMPAGAYESGMKLYEKASDADLREACRRLNTQGYQAGVYNFGTK